MGPLHYIQQGIKITDRNFRVVILYSLVSLGVVETHQYLSRNYPSQGWRLVLADFGAMAVTAALINVLVLLWLKRSIFALHKGINYPDPGSIAHCYKRFFLPLLFTAIIQLIFPALNELFPLDQTNEVTWRMEIEILSVLLSLLFLPPYMQFLEGFLVLADTRLLDAFRQSGRQIVQRFPEFMGVYFTLVGINTLVILPGLQTYNLLPVRIGLTIVQAYITVAVYVVAYLFFTKLQVSQQPSEG